MHHTLQLYYIGVLCQAVILKCQNFAIFHEIDPSMTVKKHLSTINGQIFCNNSQSYPARLCCGIFFAIIEKVFCPSYCCPVLQRTNENVLHWFYFIQSSVQSFVKNWNDWTLFLHSLKTWVDPSYILVIKTQARSSPVVIVQVK